MITLADRMQRMKPSAIREILKAANAPGLLSLAGGLPAPELFPVQAIAEAHARVFADAGPAALQYSTTEGFGPLREWLSARLATKGIRVHVDDLLVTSGAQQGIDLAARAILNEGDLVALENPSYLAAHGVFNGVGATMVTVPSDEQGMVVEELEQLCAVKPVRLIYVVPDFHNPTGRTLSLERRLALVRLAREKNIAIIEDDPYGEIRFAGTALPSLASLADGAPVVTLSTFSKTLAPGLRIGWASGPTQLIRAMTIVKQSCDLHTSTLSQRALASLLAEFQYDAHLRLLRQTYGERCTALANALETYLPMGSEVPRPQGGLFIWARLPVGFDAQALFEQALAERVSYVPGAAFFSSDADVRRVRLNFSHCSVANLEEAARRLARAFHVGALGTVATPHVASKQRQAQA